MLHSTVQLSWLALCIFINTTNWPHTCSNVSCRFVLGIPEDTNFRHSTTFPISLSSIGKKSFHIQKLGKLCYPKKTVTRKLFRNANILVSDHIQYSNTHEASLPVGITTSLRGGDNGNDMSVVGSWFPQRRESVTNQNNNSTAGNEINSYEAISKLVDNSPILPHSTTNDHPLEPSARKILNQLKRQHYDSMLMLGDDGEQQQETKAALRTLKRGGRLIIDFTNKHGNSDQKLIKSTAKSSTKLLSWTEQQSFFRQNMKSVVQNSVQTTPAIIGERDQTHGKLILSIDPSATAHILFSFLMGSTNLLSVFMGTLRLLAPLIVSQRVIATLGKLLRDYSVGRYVRKSYTRIESIYIKYYEAPAALRAVSRCSAQYVIHNFVLRRVMGFLVGVNHPPCCHGGDHCNELSFLCGILWFGSVVGAGHAFNVWLSIWGGPLRIQKQQQERIQKLNIFAQPLHILDIISEPGKWISIGSSSQARSFQPKPIIFPATWLLFRLLQIFALAKVLSTDRNNYNIVNSMSVVGSGVGSEAARTAKLISQYFIQLSLGDEWCRVFIDERRVGLGAFLIALHFFAIISFVAQAAMVNTMGAIMLVPCVIAVIISGYMNLLLFWKKLEDKEKKAALNAVFGVKEKDLNRNMYR